MFCRSWLASFLCVGLSATLTYSQRAVPPPWQGQALAYVYARGTKSQVDTAKVLTTDEARRIARNIAKLPTLLKQA